MNVSTKLSRRRDLRIGASDRLPRVPRHMLSRRRSSQFGRVHSEGESIPLTALGGLPELGGAAGCGALDQVYALLVNIHLAF